METIEQKAAGAMRVLFELDKSRDLTPQVAQILKRARNGDSKMALVQELGRIELELDDRVDGAACDRLADLILQALP